MLPSPESSSPDVPRLSAGPDPPAILAGRPLAPEGGAPGEDRRRHVSTPPGEHARLATELDLLRRELVRANAHIERLKRAHGRMRRSIRHLNRMATTDELTGLYNRRQFDATLGSAFAHALTVRSPLSIVLLDVDHFKAYNDNFGHLAGDEILRLLADRLLRNARKEDFVSRYGGEEFTMILPGVQAEEATSYADRLRVIIQDSDWPCRALTASFGVATLEPGLVSPAALVDQGDQALYYSKAHGRNRVTHYRDIPRPRLRLA